MGMDELEKQLDSFNKDERIKALKELKELAGSGAVKIKRSSCNNLHCHTFYSFNAYGYSPQHIIWRAFREGLEAAGNIDFDVLDCLEETFEAGDLLGVRATAGLETRVFFNEYADVVITSPKEPGIYYAISLGFFKKPGQGTKGAQTLEKLGQTARLRNLDVLGRINACLGEFGVDYEKDVLILTPKGNATERHIVTAIDRKAREFFGNDTERLSSFWSSKLGMGKAEVFSALDKPADLQENIRMKLIKYGGVGYAKPEKKNFPSMDEVISMTVEAGALPCAGWLDGTSEGEKDMGSMLELMIEKGAALLNIIPDRNWNIRDPEDRKLKTANLAIVMEAAERLRLPVVAGTEMNKDGQKFCDDFNVPELKPYAETLRSGAFFVYGHTALARSCGRGFQGEWAKSNFPSRPERAEFFKKAGMDFVPGKHEAVLKEKAGKDMSPSALLSLLG